MRARIFSFLIAGLMLGVLPGLAGCQTKYGTAEPPDIRVVNLRLLPASNLLEQQFELDLAIGNPNNFDFGIDGLRYVLYLNGQKFATGYSGEHVHVARLSEARITTIGRTDLAKVVRQILALPQAQSLDYRLSGDAFLSDFPKSSISFEKSGDIRLGR
jgi:LEA14-like dessication related protein